MNLKELFDSPRKFALKYSAVFWVIALIYLTVRIVVSEHTIAEKLGSLAGTYFALGLIYAISWYYLKETQDK